MERGGVSVRNVVHGIKMTLSMIVMILFRNNAIYAVVLFLAILILISVARRKADTLKKNILFCTYVFIAIVGSLIALQLLAINFNAGKGNSREMFSVPVQQIARVYFYHKDKLTDEEKSQMFLVIPEERITNYRPDLADPVKGGFQSGYVSENFLDFLELYLKLGLKYPKDYLTAFLRLNMGYWYLGDETHAYIYGSANRQGYLLTDMKNVEGINIEHNSLLPSLEALYEKVVTENVYLKVPVISALFAPSFYLWLLLASTLLAWKNGKIKGLLYPYTLMYIYFLTVLLGPCALVRYAYPLMICTPMFLAFSLKQSRGQWEQSRRMGVLKGRK